MNREKMFFFSFLEGRDKRKTRLKAFLGEHVKSAEKTKEKKKQFGRNERESAVHQR